MHWKCKSKVPGNAMYCDATYVAQVQGFERYGRPHHPSPSTYRETNI